MNKGIYSYRGGTRMGDKMKINYLKPIMSNFRYTVRVGIMEIDNTTQWIPGNPGDSVDNLHIMFIGDEPHLRLITYHKVTNNHVDVASVTLDFGLGNLGNLKQLNRIIQEKISEFENREP